MDVLPDRARDILARRARTHWTPERLRELTGGKSLLVLPHEAPHLLRALGILDAHGALQHRRERKFRQINHLLSFLRPALDELGAPGGPLRVLDAGCGRSALGFLVAWWFQRQGREVQVHGIDQNPDAIVGCRKRADAIGLDMTFEVADLAELPPPDAPVFDALLALHACDVATDHALAFAVRHGVRFFAVAPCCQAELSGAWARAGTGTLGLLHANPHFRRTLAATVTDAMRTELMREAGYEVRAVEFVEAHHTPKNTLIYGHLRDAPTAPAGSYQALEDRSGGEGITLKGLLSLVE